MRLHRIVGTVALASLVASCDSDRGLVVPPSPMPPVAAPTPSPSPSPSPSPAAERSFSGSVREVDGGPLEGVTVSAGHAGGAGTLSDHAGAFTLVAAADFLVFQKDGYRATSWSVPANANDDVLTPTVKMQRLYRLSEGAGVQSTITSDDLEYSSELQNSFWDGLYFCSPCKEIRITPALQSERQLRLRWTGSVALDLWAGEYYGGVRVSAAGQAGESELTLIVPAMSNLVLVGLGRRNGAPQTLHEAISFDLTIDAPGP